jgi:hypothetical protein
MSDLNEFFAKKDRRKKKSTKVAKPAASDSPPTTAPLDAGSASGTAGAPVVATSGPAKAAKGDDGWIDIDESNTTKVNTGGKTVGEFKRDVEEKDVNGEDIVPTEKFCGWTRSEAEEESERDAEQSAPVAAFPSLKDAADAPKVFVTKGGGGATGSSGSARYVPRFGGSNFAALKKLMEQNAQSSGGSVAGPKP